MLVPKKFGGVSLLVPTCNIFDPKGVNKWEYRWDSFIHKEPYFHISYHLPATKSRQHLHISWLVPVLIGLGFIFPIQRNP